MPHTLPGNPAATGPAVTDITAVAHLFIHGTAMDFDNAGNLITVTRDAFVDISNRASANGSGAAPVYTAPQLATGAMAAAQHADGSLPGIPTTAPKAHLDALYGRLLMVYPRPIILAPGTESIGGVVIGTATTTTSGWTYNGTWTDAPAAQATAPGSHGNPATPITVQWNHAERLDAHGGHLDETIPVSITAVTTYPDGHVQTTSTSAAIPVTIYFIGMAN